LDAAELQEFVRKALGVQLEKTVVSQLLRSLDVDGDESVQAGEFFERLRTIKYAQRREAPRISDQK
jgi:Ca2+-binding EF-hand superfamily protein